MNIVLIPIRIESEANKRGHWAVKARRAKAARGSAFLAMRAAKVPLQLPVTITLTRIAPRALDDDNLRAGFKALRDGIADWYGLDDRSPQIRWEYGQRKGQPKEYAAEVAVEVAA